MPWPQSAAPDLHLERARDHVGRSRTAGCADYWRGGVPGPGVVVERSYVPSQTYEIAKNGEENGWFLAGFGL
jgi:hypothetical protein